MLARTPNGTRVSAAAALAAVLAISGGLFGGDQATANRMRGPSSPTWRLTWHQEFNGRAGSRLGPHEWAYDRGGEPRWGNQEWEYYTSRSQNISMDGRGHLAITARRQRLPGMAHCLYGTCDITSARVTTKGLFAQRYGRFEARIRVPAGQGMWPALWLLGADVDHVGWPACGEIDAMEVIGRRPRTVYGTIHAPGYADQGIGGMVRATSYLASSFYSYGVDWNPDRITWTLDGRPYFTASKSQLKPGQKWPFDRPFYILLNLAVGGDWPGAPNSRTPFPATMLIDWIRVYTRA